MLAKAFTVWGGYPEIKAMQEQAKKSITNLPDLLKTHGINTENLENETREIDGENFTITKGRANCTINGKTYSFDIEFRVKSIRSILLKLWENEDYNNGDALRDMVGIAVICDDDFDTPTRLEIMKLFTNIMYPK